jgi:threonine synthase
MVIVKCPKCGASFDTAVSGGICPSCKEPYRAERKIILPPVRFEKIEAKPILSLEKIYYKDILPTDKARNLEDGMERLQYAIGEFHVFRILDGAKIYPLKRIQGKVVAFTIRIPSIEEREIPVTIEEIPEEKIRA